MDRADNIILAALIIASLTAVYLLPTFNQSAENPTLPANISSYVSHAPILIMSNSGFNASNGVVSGMGADSDPYIIEGWDINASTVDGIYIQDTNLSFIVRNCYVHGGGRDRIGIQLSICSNGKLIDNHCSNNYYGIGLFSTNITVNNNTCSNNLYGIGLSSSSNNTLSNNSCNSNEYVGIGVYSSSNNNILINNTCNSNNNYGIALYLASNSILKNNTCSSNNYFDIYLASSSNNTLDNNTCSNTWGGIYLASSSNNILSGNIMIGDGILIGGSSISRWNTHNIDTSNTVNGRPVYYYKNQSGITVPTGAGEIILANCTDSIIENQSLGDSNVGIELGYSSRITVTNNSCSNNKIGIILYSSSNNTIFRNLMENNAGYGVSISSGSNNRIWNNTFTDNNGAGSSYNSEHIQAYDNGTSNWWNTSGTHHSYGNYWSDWTRLDANHDGIIDNPYTISGGVGAKDYYPLTAEPISRTPTSIIIVVIIIAVVMVALVALLVIILLVRKKKP